MQSTDELLGIKKPDMNELREVKVKLPVRQLLKLHFLKLTSGKTFSDVVAEALVQYLAKLEQGTGEPAAPPQHPASTVVAPPVHA